MYAKSNVITKCRMLEHFFDDGWRKSCRNRAYLSNRICWCIGNRRRTSSRRRYCHPGTEQTRPGAWRPLPMWRLGRWTGVLTPFRLLLVTEGLFVRTLSEEPSSGLSLYSLKIVQNNVIFFFSNKTRCQNILRWMFMGVVQQGLLARTRKTLSSFFRELPCTSLFKSFTIWCLEDDESVSTCCLAWSDRVS